MAELPSVEIRVGEIPLPAEAVALYRDAGWWGNEDDFNAMRKMLDGSFAVVCARSQDRLVGMMRALSDGTSDAYMLDLVVAKDFRRRGIGGKIAGALSSHLHQCGVEWIVCIGGPGTENLYGRCRGAAEMARHTPWRFFGKEEE